MLSHPEEPIPNVHTVSELLELITADPATWQEQWVSARFVKHPEVELGIYWQFDEDAPYFDVSYRAQVKPAKVLASFLASHPTCEVIDWCPGRLLTVRANGATARNFGEVILTVVSELHGPVDQRLAATHSPMGRA